MRSLLHCLASRREFFTGAGRSLAVLALAAFGGWQEIKRQRLAQDPQCLKLAACSDCVESGRCRKPKRMSALSSR